MNINEVVKKFVRKNRITDYRLQKLHTSQAIIRDICKNYCKRVNEYDAITKYVINRTRLFKGVHATTGRVKSISRILQKIHDDDLTNVNVGNYNKKIKDLIGVRIMHLFRDDWEFIHQQIISTWNVLEKKAFNYEREYEVVFNNVGFTIKNSSADYRSLHYLIEVPFTKSENINVEIQVRTLFEEAWSEVDHIRYEHDKKDRETGNYMRIFNHSARLADEMGSFFKYEIIAKERDPEKTRIITKRIQELSWDLTKDLKFLVGDYIFRNK